MGKYSVSPQQTMLKEWRLRVVVLIVNDPEFTIVVYLQERFDAH